MFRQEKFSFLIHFIVLTEVDFRLKSRREAVLNRTKYLALSAGIIRNVPVQTASYLLFHHSLTGVGLQVKLNYKEIFYLSRLLKYFKTSWPSILLSVLRCEGANMNTHRHTQSLILFGHTIISSLNSLHQKFPVSYFPFIFYIIIFRRIISYPVCFIHYQLENYRCYEKCQDNM